MNITVYCGASEGNNPVYAEAAKELGAWMAEHGHTLVYGGGNSGMMGALSKAVIKGGGRTIGVTPDFFVYAEEIEQELAEIIITKDMSERRLKMMELGEAFIALPGGTGTLDEIAEVIAMKRLGMFGDVNRPVMLYNADGYYDSLFEFFDVIRDSGFYRPEDRNNIIEARNIEDVARALESAGEIDITRNKLYE